VVGKGKGKGHGARLLQICLDDARAQGKHGMVMVASDGVWLAKKDIFLKHGFEEIAQAPPSFQLLAYRFDNAAPLPTFPTDWEGRQARFGPGLTVIRTPQCPYGVFGIVLDDQLLAYHYLQRKDFDKPAA
jgi:hypothetical protein